MSFQDHHFSNSGSGSDVYAGWFDEHLGRSLAERDALGFAGMIKASLAREPGLQAEETGPQPDDRAASTRTVVPETAEETPR